MSGRFYDSISFGSIFFIHAKRSEDTQAWHCEAMALVGGLICPGHGFLRGLYLFFPHFKSPRYSLSEGHDLCLLCADVRFQISDFRPGRCAVFRLLCCSPHHLG
jgi:hypothetical protein